MAAIVALVPPDTKATRRIDKTPLNPNGRKLRKFEKDGEARLYEALQKWGRALFRGVTADTVALLTARLDDPEFNKPLRDVLIMFLQDVADAGAEHGREQVERVFMGVKRLPDISAGAVDWTAANADAAQWAIEYGYQLIGGITDTTRAQIAREIRYFVDNGITINQLRDRLMAGNLFSRNRAEMIAITEVTRAFAEGNEAAWRTSKVVEKKEWMTAFDEIVCPICGPLSGMIVPINESFGRINKPPAHPRCRCYILPVVAGDDEVLSPVGLGPWTTGITQHVYAASGNPLSEYFDTSGLPASLRSEIDAALAAIDGAHGGDRVSHNIPVVRTRAGSYAGQYRYKSARNAAGKVNVIPENIRISPNAGAGDIQSVFIHEVGHYLDNSMMRQNMRGILNVDVSEFFSESNHPLAIAWRKAISESSAAQEWLTYAVNPPVPEIDINTIRYATSTREMWARSYAQYVTNRSADPELIGQLRMINDGWGGAKWQWDDDDFGPIAKAIDDLLLSMGWIR